MRICLMKLTGTLMNYHTAAIQAFTSNMAKTSRVYLPSVLVKNMMKTSEERNFKTTLHSRSMYVYMKAETFANSK